MQPCRQMLVLVLLLLLFLAGCEGTGEDGDGDTALLRISIGGSGATAQQQGAEASLSPVIPRQQESPAIPVEVDQIRLMVDRTVSVGGTVFPANSAIDIPIDPSRDTASLTLEIDANIAHQFTIEALNEQQEIIFQRVFNVNVDPGPQSLSITLMAVTGPGPMVVSPLVDIPPLVLFADQSLNRNVDLTGVFLDDNNEDLTLTAASDNTALVTATVVGTTLTLSIQQEEEGTATITVTATDESGNSATDSFTVTVTRVTGGSGG